IGREHPFDIGVMSTMKSSQMTLSEKQLRRTVERRGGHFESLLDGTVAATRGASGMATDRVGRAGSCALAPRASAGRRPIALSTGRGEITSKLALGDAIDRAAKMLAHVAHYAEETEEPTDTAAPVVIDEVTAGLLDARFDVRWSHRG